MTVNHAEQGAAKYCEFRNRAMRAETAAYKLGISVSLLWAKVNPSNTRFDPTFPKPFKVSDNVTVWLESELDSWLESKAMASRITQKE